MNPAINTFTHSVRPFKNSRSRALSKQQWLSRKLLYIESSACRPKMSSCRREYWLGLSNKMWFKDLNSWLRIVRCINREGVGCLQQIMQVCFKIKSRVSLLCNHFFLVRVKTLGNGGCFKIKCWTKMDLWFSQHRWWAGNQCALVIDAIRHMLSDKCWNHISFSSPFHHHCLHFHANCHQLDRQLGRLLFFGVFVIEHRALLDVPLS